MPCHCVPPLLPSYHGTIIIIDLIIINDHQWWLSSEVTSKSNALTKCISSPFFEYNSKCERKHEQSWFWLQCRHKTDFDPGKAQGSINAKMQENYLRDIFRLDEHTRRNNLVGSSNEDTMMARNASKYWLHSLASARWAAKVQNDCKNEAKWQNGGRSAASAGGEDYKAYMCCMSMLMYYLKYRCM